MTAEPQRMSGRLQDGTECVLHIDENGVRLEIDRDHKHAGQIFELPNEPERLVMRITGNQVATLTGVYRTQRRSNLARSFEEYRANITYIGPIEFVPELGIRKLAIRPTNQLLAVMYNGHRTHCQIAFEDTTLGTMLTNENLGERYYVDIIDIERRQAFKARVKGLAISANIDLSVLSNIQGRAITEYRTFILDYENSSSMAISISDMLTVCDFMSLMVGAVISPAFVEAVATGENDSLGRPPTFKVYARWRTPGDEIDPQKGRRCLAAPLFNSALYERAMATWMSRREDWRISYALGTICLTHQGEISSRRFLDAAVWFESIPIETYKRRRKRIGKKAIAAAASAASAVFQSKDADVSEHRARALLGAVNAASLSERIKDAMAFVRLIDSDILPENLDALAAVVSKIRGKFAHGEDAFASDLGHAVHHATLLLEVLAFGLTIAELGNIRFGPELSGHPHLGALLELHKFDGGLPVFP